MSSRWLALLLLASCAHAQPHLWEICRDACAVKGGVAAAVVGSTNAHSMPACMCGAAQEGT